MNRITKSIANEAELRAKVVDVWLRDHGFSSDQIRLESSFTISLGRGSFTVDSNQKRRSEKARGRSDYLVRTADGQNLLIIEAKAPDSPLDEDARIQAISYARLLRDGGIAPFAIVTNGKQTQIFDSVTGNALSEDVVPPSHPYAIAGFRITGDDLSCRAEALEHLISISTENLITFCREQTKARMALLRSESIDSGLKYIPSLFIPRQLQEASLDRLVDGSHQCILVIGPPQVGKTNFICNYVERQLDRGTPCLFYPAIAQTSGLLDAIRADFEWTFNESGASAHAVCRKLIRVLEKTNKKLLIFAEGINENREFVRVFNADVERLQNPRITLVASLTSFSARDLLLDDAGNPTYPARAAGVRKDELPILEVNPSTLSSTLALVAIGPYSAEEAALAYLTYRKAYRVDVPVGHQFTHDPLLLRSAMEAYQDRSLPTVLNADEVLEKTIVEKLLRAPGVSASEGPAIVKEVADRLSRDLSVSDFWLLERLTGARGLFEAAILVGRGGRAIDFYVTSERSFVIAYWVREWHQVLRKSKNELINEVSFASKHEVARAALRWFMIQSNNLDILTRIPEALEDLQDANTRKTMALCLCDYLANTGTNDSIFDDIEDESGRHALNRLLYAETGGECLISQALVNMICDDAEQYEIRKLSAIGLAVFDPEECISILSREVGKRGVESESILLDMFEPGLRRAMDEVLESYYNSRDLYCSSRLSYLDKHERLEEYQRLHELCLLAIQLFGSTNEAIKLEELLRKLNADHKPIRRKTDSRLQVPLDFKVRRPWQRS